MKKWFACIAVVALVFALSATTMFAKGHHGGQRQKAEVAASAEPCPYGEDCPYDGNCPYDCPGNAAPSQAGTGQGRGGHHRQGSTGTGRGTGTSASREACPYGTDCPYNGDCPYDCPGNAAPSQAGAGHRRGGHCGR